MDRLVRDRPGPRRPLDQPPRRPAVTTAAPPTEANPGRTGNQSRSQLRHHHTAGNRHLPDLPLPHAGPAATALDTQPAALIPGPPARSPATRPARQQAAEPNPARPKDMRS